MSFQDDDPSVIRWRLHLNCPPHQVYEMLTSNEGCARFWAEEAVERDGHIQS